MSRANDQVKSLGRAQLFSSTMPSGWTIFK